MCVRVMRVEDEGVLGEREVAIGDRRLMEAGMGACTKSMADKHDNF